MTRVVADTNVLVSAILYGGPPRRFLQRCIEGDFTLVTSPALLAELAEVLSRPRFGFGANAAQDAVAGIIHVSEIVEPTSSFHAVEADPDDDAVLHAAVDGKADCIVSGDQHLLKLGGSPASPSSASPTCFRSRDVGRFLSNSAPLKPSIQSAFYPLAAPRARAS